MENNMNPSWEKIFLSHEESRCVLCRIPIDSMRKNDVFVCIDDIIVCDKCLRYCLSVTNNYKHNLECDERERKIKQRIEKYKEKFCKFFRVLCSMIVVGV